MKTITVVIPVLDEARSLAASASAVLEVLDRLDDVRGEVLFVDDGSRDATADVARELARRDRRVGFLCLARHFGKENAIHAGLAQVRCDAAVVMDADLQHPPGLIPEMVRLWRAGVPVVEAVKRRRGLESRLSRLTASVFYRLFDAFSELDIRDHTDFKLLDRRVVDAYLELPERRRFFRGLVRWMAFPSAQIPFDVPSRLHGRRRFGFIRRLGLSIDAVTAFSTVPLQLITTLGGVALLLGVVIGGIALRDKFTGQAVSGFATVILLILILGGLTMVGLGLIGVYLAHVFDEVKGRPLYRIDASRSSLLDGNSGVQRETPAPLQERRATASESAAEESMTRGGESAAHPSGDR